MNPNWLTVQAADVRVDDRLRLASGTELTVTRVENGFLGSDDLVCFVEDKHFNIIGTESSTILNHIQHTSRCTNDDMDTFLKNSDILANDSSSNTSVAL